MKATDTPKDWAIVSKVTVLNDSKNWEQITILISLVKYFLCYAR